MSTITISHLKKDYTLKAGFLKQISGKGGVVSAVSDISLVLKESEIVGLVGESGCGKTTLGKMLVRIESPTSGEILIDGKDITRVKRADARSFRKEVQMIFQDPYDSLDPKMSIRDIVAEPLQYLNLAKSSLDTTKQVTEILEKVGLSPPEQYLNRYPHQLSGGQRQRVSIARALVVHPKFVVADEPVSMLDVSIRAGILNLLQDMNKELGIGMLLITHDLATARYLCDRIVVMYLGKIMEIALPQTLVDNPAHPYSKLLLSSAPDLFAETDSRTTIEGEAASAVNPPNGCRFWPRCSYATEVCKNEEPNMRELETGHFAACHYAECADSNKKG